MCPRAVCAGRPAARAVGSARRRSCSVFSVQIRHPVLEKRRGEDELKDKTLSVAGTTHFEGFPSSAESATGGDDGVPPESFEHESIHINTDRDGTVHGAPGFFIKQ